jgi:hypothetical protein
MVLGLWEAEDIGVVSTEGHKAGGRGCKFSDKAFQPSEQVEERDYLTCLPLWLRYRLVAFLGSLKYGGNFLPDVCLKL